MTAGSPTAGTATLERDGDALATKQARTQRERMLRAMAEAVAEHGYGSTTVAHVIERAGVSRKTFYQHFDDRLDCFLTAYDEASKLLLQGTRHAFAHAGEPRARMVEAIRTYLDSIAAEAALAHTYLVAVYGAGPEALRRRLEVFDQFVALVAAMNRDLAQEDPSVRTLSPFEVRALVGAISSIVTLLLAAGRADEIPDQHADVVALIERTFTT